MLFLAHHKHCYSLTSTCMKICWYSNMKIYEKKLAKNTFLLYEVTVHLCMYFLCDVAFFVVKVLRSSLMFTNILFDSLAHRRLRVLLHLLRWLTARRILFRYAVRISHCTRQASLVYAGQNVRSKRETMNLMVLGRWIFLLSDQRTSM